MSVRYIVDDHDADITYLCPVKQQNDSMSYFQSTWTTIKDESCHKGWFEYTFNGTAIQINAPALHDGNDFSVQLDETHSNPFGRGQIELSDLSDAEHTIRVSMGNKTQYSLLDYLVVTAGESSSLRYKNLIVDNEDLTFSGSWTTESPSALSFDYSSSLYAKTARWTNTAGDSMSYQFVGSYLDVYGFVVSPSSASDSIPSSNMTTTYTIDGEDAWTIQLPTTSPNFTQLVPLFSADLKLGNHTLEFRVDSVDTAGYSLGIDFLVYNTSSYEPVVEEPMHGPSHLGRTGTIVLAVLLGVAALLLLVLAFFLIRRRRSGRNSNVPATSEHDLELTTTESGKTKTIYDDELPVLHKH